MKFTYVLGACFAVAFIGACDQQETDSGRTSKGSESSSDNSSAYEGQLSLSQPDLGVSDVAVDPSSSDSAAAEEVSSAEPIAPAPKDPEVPPVPQHHFVVALVSLDKNIPSLKHVYIYKPGSKISIMGIRPGVYKLIISLVLGKEEQFRGVNEKVEVKSGEVTPAKIELNPVNKSGGIDVIIVSPVNPSPRPVEICSYLQDVDKPEAQSCQQGMFRCQVNIKFANDLVKIASKEMPCSESAAKRDLLQALCAKKIAKDQIDFASLVCGQGNFPR